MKKLKLVSYYFLIISLFSCGEGYEKVDNGWAWIQKNENGDYVTKLNIDQNTFQVLDDEEFAKDKQNVFFRGVIINLAEPKTFQTLSHGYSKDSKHVFLENEIIIFAKPDKFKILKWPFSKDNRFIFNGTVPLTSKNIEKFVVTKSIEEKSTMIKSFFLEKYKAYQWIDTINCKQIIISEESEGKTDDEKFIGIKKIE